MRDFAFEDVGVLPSSVPFVWTLSGYDHLPDGSFLPVYSYLPATTPLAPASPQPATATVTGAASNDTADSGTNSPQQGQSQPAMAPTTGGQSSKYHSKKDREKTIRAKHICFNCDEPRSTHYHMQHPVKHGSKPQLSCCNHCRKRLFDDADEVASRSKYLQHFCDSCGTLRSKSYHDDHPIPPGKKPRPSYCIVCRMRMKNKAHHVDNWEGSIDDDVSPDFVQFQCKNGRILTSRRNRSLLCLV